MIRATLCARRWAAIASRTSDQPQGAGSCDRRAPAAYIELAVDALDVGLHGVGGHEQLRADLGVREQSRQQAQQASGEADAAESQVRVEAGGGDDADRAVVDEVAQRRQAAASQQ